MVEEDEDLTLDIELRSKHDVATRLVNLAGLIHLALDAIGEPGGNTLENDRVDLIEALQIGSSAEGLATSEREALDSLAEGRIAEESVLELLWRAEALTALAWAAGLKTELSEPWNVADIAAVTGRIPLPWDDLDPFVATLRLRSEAAFATQREAAELWLWRCAVESELQASRGREGSDLQSAVTSTAGEAEAAGILRASGGDFAVHDQAFAQADSETKAVIAEISMQRLLAFNWLCGFGSTWDETPLDI